MALKTEQDGKFKAAKKDIYRRIIYKEVYVLETSSSWGKISVE